MKASRRDFLLKMLAGASVVPALSRCVHERVAPFLELQQPEGEAVLRPNEIYQIRWQSLNIETIRIEFSSNAGQIWSIVAEAVPAQQSTFDWEVPRRNSDQCLIRISSNANPAIKAESSRFFSIFEQYVVSLSEHPELQQANGFKVLLEATVGAVAILRTAGEFKVLSLSCPHASCTVGWSESTNSFDCPCHGSAFSQQGCLRNGPAQRNLWEHSFRFDNTANQLIVFAQLKEGKC